MKSLSIFSLLFTMLIANEAPVVPDSINTQLYGDTTTTIDFWVQTTDPDNDRIAYQFDWGDGMITEWSSYLQSGYLFSANHLYRKIGEYSYLARVKDDEGNISEWSAPGTINIIPQLLLWTYETGSGIYNSCALDLSNEIYIACEDGSIQAINQDGTLRWKFQTLSSIYTAPVVGKKAIYITTTEGNLIAIDFNGKEIWRYKADNAIYSSPALSKDALYFGCDDGNLYAVNLSGKLLWKYKTGDEIAGSPSIDKNGTVYVASDAVYALSSKGKEKWVFRPDEEYEAYFFASPCIGSDGTIYIGGIDGALYAITNNGRLKWRAPTPDEDAIRAAAATSKNNVVYFGDENGILHKKEKYGDVKALYETDNYIFSAPAIDSLNNIYFVSDDGFFYCLGQDGKLLYKWLIAEDSKEIMYSPCPIISNDGVVYIGSWEGKLYSFKSFAPPAKNSWSMSRHNQQNTANLKK